MKKSIAEQRKACIPDLNRDMEAYEDCAATLARTSRTTRPTTGTVHGNCSSGPGHLRAAVLVGLGAGALGVWAGRHIAEALLLGLGSFAGAAAFFNWLIGR